MEVKNKYKSKIVKIGNVEIGGDNPVLIQSMTNTKTIDTIETVEQIIRIVDAGANIVRISTPTIKDAENLKNIKEKLLQKGYNIPLVADIHFNPKIAEIAAKIVDKIRINPGNFVDKKKEYTREFLLSQYQEELEKIKKQFIPLLQTCKQHNTAIRIGVNHGSLSERIINKYGDTPAGMVESAMEYIKICEDENFHNIVLSIKSSNTRIMVYANRLLFERMKTNGIVYPLHLGVTEAGFGEEGRIKSAVGISTLLTDGIGDTIRVSLTEAPEYEIPVAKQIVEYSLDQENTTNIQKSVEYLKRKTFVVDEIGGNNKPVVIAGLGSKPCIDEDSLNELGYFFNDNIWKKEDTAVDYVYAASDPYSIGSCKIVKLICNYNAWKNQYNTYPLFTIKEFLNCDRKSEVLNFVTISYNKLNYDIINNLKNNKTIVLILTTTNKISINEHYEFFNILKNNNCKIPVIIHRVYTEQDIENMQIKCTCDIGGLLIDGFGEGVWVSNILTSETSKVRNTVFNIMQASRIRFTKPEYISCPSCSRTLFDIEKICAEIKEKTSELKNIKIGIMGCIVNGPGEMADADYGYVGSGINKISLYKGKEVIKKNIPEDNAINELIELIKANGDWKITEN